MVRTLREACAKSIPVMLLIIGLAAFVHYAGEATKGVVVEEVITKAYAGDVESQVQLAQMFELGRFLPLDLEKAEIWYSLAAQKGDRFAAERLLRLYEKR